MQVRVGVWMWRGSVCIQWKLKLRADKWQVRVDVCIGGREWMC